MSMYNDISWGDKNNERVCLANSRTVGCYARNFALGHWSFLGSGSETKWNATDILKSGGECGHPICRATSALDRGQSKSKGAGRLSIHFCADEATIETIFRTIISVNQISIYGAVADLCEEFGQTLIDSEKTYVVMEPFDLLDIQKQLPTDEEQQDDILLNHKESVQNLSNEEQLIKLSTDAGFVKTVADGQYFMTKDAEEFSEFDGDVGCREYTLPRDDESSTPRGWIR